jgi:hypothetical protein
MDRAEFLAMLDISADPPDGVYPTLDDYLFALKALADRERLAPTSPDKPVGPYVWVNAGPCSDNVFCSSSVTVWR